MCTNTAVIDRINKLLALADKNKNTNDNEALQALEMAQRLMAKHQIESTDLEELARDESDVIHVACEHKWDAGYRKPLASIISNNYKCKCYVRGGLIIFIGVREDAMIAKAAFEFAYKFIMRRGNALYEKTRKEGYVGKGVFNSYAMGFLCGLKEVLEAQSVALMIVTPETVLKEFNDMSLGKGSGGIRQDSYYEDIYNNGYNDAKDQYGTKAITAGGN